MVVEGEGDSGRGDGNPWLRVWEKYWKQVGNNNRG